MNNTDTEITIQDKLQKYLLQPIAGSDNTINKIKDCIKNHFNDKCDFKIAKAKLPRKLKKKRKKEHVLTMEITYRDVETYNKVLGYNHNIDITFKV